MQANLASSLERIVQQYQNYSQEVVGLRPATCLARLRWARLWLNHAGVTSRQDLQRLTGAQVVECLRHPPDAVNPHSLAGFVSGLRCFLKFLYVEGHLSQALACALPPVAHPARTRPLEYLSPAQWQQLLDRLDRRRKVGRRDYAILLCAARLGLRAGEIATLQLEDLDWDNGTLRLGRTKNRRGTLLPLSPVLGQALAAYLQRGRPVTRLPWLFVSAALPPHALTHHGVSKVVKQALLRAGLVLGRYGAHVLRRTFAMRLAEQGHSLKTVADLLRHQQIQTTLQYVKATPSLLTTVVQPWPEVRS
jgi:integrase